MSVPAYAQQHYPAQPVPPGGSPSFTQPGQGGHGGGEDLFAPDGPKRRSVSFKDAPVGTQYRWQIIDQPEKVQSIDYISKEPAFWDKEKTEPKMSIVVGVHDLMANNGEELGLWMKYRSALHKAIIAAVERSGVPVIPGTIIDAQITGYQSDPARPQAQPARQWQAWTTAGAPPVAVSDDPFAPPAPPIQAPVQQVPQVQQAQQAAPVQPSGWNRSQASAPPPWAGQPAQPAAVPTLPTFPVASAYAPPPAAPQVQQAAPAEQTPGVLAAAAELGLNL